MVPKEGERFWAIAIWNTCWSDKGNVLLHFGEACLYRQRKEYRKREKYRKRDKRRQKSEKEKATNKGIEGAQFEALSVKCGTSKI